MLRSNSEGNNSNPAFIDKAKPFSESYLWQFNKTYYQSKGITPWTSGELPYHLTSNARVGKSYAEIIFSFLKDVSRNGNTTDPVHILELGSGHGKLAFHIIQNLDLLIAEEPDPIAPYLFVISDIGDSNLEFFESHPQFRSYINRGVLDVAFFDAVSSKELFLRISGRLIKEKDLKQPIVSIGNYFFDSIPSDLFYFQNGKVAPCLLRLESNLDVNEATAEDMLKSLKFSYGLGNNDEAYYEDEIKNQIIEEYKPFLKHTYMPFPISGVDCMNAVRGLSTVGMILISMDKGSHTVENLDGISTPDMVLHGSMSFLVNYHALGAHCEKSGGEKWFPQSSDFYLQMVCLAYLDDVKKYPRTKTAYNRFVEDIGPDDFNSYKRFVYDNMDKATIQDLITFLRMFAYDSVSFEKILPIIKQLIGKVSKEERGRLSEMLQKVWDTHYMIKNEDLAFEIAGLYYQLGYYDKALSFFVKSESMYGVTADGYYNRLLCYYQLRQDELFVKTLSEAKLKFPDYANFQQIDNLDLGAK